MDALAILQRLAGGYLIEELAAALTVTAEEVVATGKPGTVTLSLKVSTRNQGDPLIVVEEQIARAAPKKDAKAAFFYALDGDLHRDDPRQARLDFRTVDRETGEIRDTRGDNDIREVSS
jgi:hypothetical protein